MSKKQPIEGECKLCLQYKKLLKSHIYPRFLYLNMLKDDNHFLDIENDKVKKSQHQKTKHLLCDECEKLLNKHESIVAPLLKGDWLYEIKSFKIKSTSNQDRPFMFKINHRHIRKKHPKSNQINLDHSLNVFAWSIFWRSSFDSNQELHPKHINILNKVRLAILNNEKDPTWFTQDKTLYIAHPNSPKEPLNMIMSPMGLIEDYGVVVHFAIGRTIMHLNWIIEEDEFIESGIPLLDTYKDKKHKPTNLIIGPIHLILPKYLIQSIVTAKDGRK